MEEREPHINPRFALHELSFHMHLSEETSIDQNRLAMIYSVLKYLEGFMLISFQQLIYSLKILD